MKKYITILAAAVLIAGCSKPGNTPAQPVEPVSGSISLSEESVIAGPEGKTFEIQVTSSSEWHVAGYSEWVEFASLSGKSGQNLVFTVAENTGESLLTAEFKVFSDDAAKTLTVKSAPNYTIALSGEETEFETSSDAGAFYVTLETNVDDIAVDIDAPWLTLSRIEDVLGKTKLYMDVARSQDFKSRKANITIGGTGVETPLAVSLVQAQRDTAFVEEGQSFVKGLEALDLTLNIKSNVDISYKLPSWLTETEATDSEMDEATGLKTRTVKLHADACGGSRAANIKFSKEGGDCGFVYIKQQNPNPVFADVKDETLAGILESAGWVLTDPATGKSEILEPGLEGTSLTIGSMSGRSQNGISSLEGLEAFPKLETLNVGNVSNLTKIDISALPAIKNVKFYNLWNIEEINFGAKDIAKIDCSYDGGGKCVSSDIVFKGEKVKEIYFSGTRKAYFDEENGMNSIDVTLCPALEKLDCKRTCQWGNSALSTIYMTAAQEASVQVNKLDSTSIVVK